MTNKRRTLGLTLPLLLAACQPATPFVSTAFRLAGPDDAPAAASATHGGSLTVRFDQALRARRLLATIADVHHVRIVLTGPTPQTVDVPAASIAAGQATHTFTSLDAGAYDVAITAVDAAGHVLGADTQHATVTAGQTAIVASTVSLVPGIANPRPVPTRAPGGGGSAPTTGDLAANVTLIDGVAVVTPAIAAQHFGAAPTDPASEVHPAVDTTGAAWFVFDKKLYYVQSDGTVAPVALAYDALDVVASADGTRVHVSGHLGQIQTPGSKAFPAVPGPTSSSYESSLAGWLHDGGRGPFLLNKAGTYESPWFSTIGFTMADMALYHPTMTMQALETTFGGSTFGRMSKATTDMVHALRRGSDQSLVRLHENFTEVWQKTFAGADDLRFAFDAQDDLWVVDTARRQLVEIAPAGTTKGTYPLPAGGNDVFVDATGDVWVYTSTHQESLTGAAGEIVPDAGAPGELITRLGGDGRVKAYYEVGDGVALHEIIVKGDHLWAGTKAHGLLDLTIPAL